MPIELMFLSTTKTFVGKLKADPVGEVEIEIFDPPPLLNTTL